MSGAEDDSGARAAAGAGAADMARIALACMDLTSLGEADTALTVADLVARSRGRFGAPGALCVWPRFVAQVRGSLQALHGARAPRVAAVANFPSGQEPLPAVLAQVRGIVADGGHEVDMVLDWQALRMGDTHAGRAAAATVRAVRQACRGAALKLIIESGSLQDPALIRQACLIGLNEGVDFLKTSTGKTAVGATPEAARMLAMFGGGTFTALAFAWAVTASGLVTHPALARELGWLAILGLTAAFLLGNLALQYGAARLSAHTTAMVMLSEVVFASVSSVILGAAQWDARTGIGGALILLAALLSVWPVRSSR